MYWQSRRHTPLNIFYGISSVDEMLHCSGSFPLHYVSHRATPKCPAYARPYFFGFVRVKQKSPAKQRPFGTVHAYANNIKCEPEHNFCIIISSRSAPAASESFPPAFFYYARLFPFRIISISFSDDSPGAGIGSKALCHCIPYTMFFGRLCCSGARKNSEPSARTSGPIKCVIGKSVGGFSSAQNRAHKCSIHDEHEREKMRAHRTQAE